MSFQNFVYNVFILYFLQMLFSFSVWNSATFLCFKAFYFPSACVLPIVFEIICFFHRASKGTVSWGQPVWKDSWRSEAFKEFTSRKYFEPIEELRLDVPKGLLQVQFNISDTTSTPMQNIPSIVVLVRVLIEKIQEMDPSPLRYLPINLSN